MGKVKVDVDLSWGIGLDFIPADVYMSGHARMTPSSRGLGRYPFKVETRVRNPLGSPSSRVASSFFPQSVVAAIVLDA